MTQLGFSQYSIIPFSPWEAIMLRWIETLLIVVALTAAATRCAHAQPALKMGYSGAGVAQSL